MDEVKTIQELKEKVKNFCAERDWDQFHSPKDLAIGLSTESAELLELFRFKSDAEILNKMQDMQFRQKIQNELADTLFFILRFAQKNDMDLVSALQEKMKINAANYPVEKAKGSNKKYDE
jgi:NTP pyrophosphatase (non-canonical NTP hydrolase)